MAMRAALLGRLKAVGDADTRIVADGAAVGALIFGVSAGVRHEILSLEPPRIVLPDDEEAASSHIDRALANRKIRHRSILSQDMDTIGTAWERDALREMARLGEPARMSRSVPMRVLVYDRQTVFAAVDPDDTRAGAYVSTNRSVVDLAVRLFEEIWAAAVPLTDLESEPDGTSERVNAEVLRGLSEGLTDAAIARRLGISSRTVLRAIAQLQQVYGVTSRFQLGARISEAGLLPAPWTMSQTTRPVS
jgi:DNA-binding CsgD family transcriptional regulator